ncbi:MAG: hypothetical protein C5B58_09000 [Acidobacteria bacterium]|nr:MAG: hypothetical protein C5B58_09000 [Acidobacteriota bacterium]
MTNTYDREHAVIAEQAADWFVNNQSVPTAAERETFIKWLKASPQHVHEYLGVASVARDLRQTASPEDFALEELLRRAKAEERDLVQPLRPFRRASVAIRPLLQRAAVAASVTTLGIVGFHAWSVWNAKFPREHLARAAPQTRSPQVVTTDRLLETRRGEQSSYQLVDGSVVHLNTDTRIRVSPSESPREVELLEGQAAFKVVHDTKRPFVVHANSVDVTAVDARFDVHTEPGPQITVVTVLEGRVTAVPGPVPEAGIPSAQSTPEPDPRVPIELGPSQQLSVSGGTWPAAPQAVDARRTTSWLRGEMLFEHEPLERVVAEVNRYAQTPIEIATHALRELPISGVFSTHDPEAFVAFLRSLDGVRVEVAPTRILVHSEANASARTTCWQYFSQTTDHSGVDKVTLCTRGTEANLTNYFHNTGDECERSGWLKGESNAWTFVFEWGSCRNGGRIAGRIAPVTGTCKQRHDSRLECLGPLGPQGEELTFSPTEKAPSHE